MTKEEYLGIAMKEMILNRVDVSFILRKNNSKNTTSFFDPLQGKNWQSTPRLTVKYFDSDFDYIFETFLHEYCHYKQWKDQTDIWKDGLANWLLFELYIQGKYDNFTLEQLKTIQVMELDCDKRALREMKQYNLDIDTRKYIKESNSYIYSYNISYDTKDFYSIIDYTDENLLKFIPAKHMTANNIQTRIPKYDEYYTQVLNV
jgi:hypothetical protein